MGPVARNALGKSFSLVRGGSGEHERHAEYLRLAPRAMQKVEGSRPFIRS